jgi:hypothetical protein
LAQNGFRVLDQQPTVQLPRDRHVQKGRWLVMYKSPTPQQQINHHLVTVLSGLTESVAQIGQALSVHLPIADIDEVADQLTVVNSHLSILDGLVNE